MTKSPPAPFWVNHTNRALLIEDMKRGGYAHTAEFFAESIGKNVASMNLPWLPDNLRSTIAPPLLNIINAAFAEGKSQAFIFADDPADSAPMHESGPDGFAGFELLLLAARRVFIVYGEANPKVYRAAIGEALGAERGICVIVETNKHSLPSWERMLDIVVAAGPGDKAAKIVICHPRSSLN